MKFFSKTPKETASVKKIGRFFSPSFFGNILHRSWPVMVFIAIVQFFSLTLYFSMDFPNFEQMHRYGETYSMAELYDRLHDRLISTLLSENFTPIILLLGGIVCAIVATSFLNTRKHTYFLHSLPLTREAIYFGKYLCGAIDFLLPFTLNMLPLYAVVWFTGAKMSVMALPLLIFWLKSCVWFLFFYTFTYALSYLCSGHVVKFLFSIMALYYLPLMWLLIVYLGTRNTHYLNIDYYINQTILERLSPGIRLFTDWYVNTPLQTAEYFILLAASVALLALGLVLYRHRGSENSEKTVAFRRVGRVMQYWVLLPATGVGGLALYELADRSPVWAFIGFALGALLSFMITNALLARNAREMFKKPHGLLIFFAVFILLFAGLNTAYKRIDSCIPSASDVRAVEVRIGDGTTTFVLTDKVEIGHLNALIKGTPNAKKSLSSTVGNALSKQYGASGKWLDEALETSPVSTYEELTGDIDIAGQSVYVEYNGHRSFSLDLRYKLNSGLTLAKGYNIWADESCAEHLQVLLNSAAFKEAYLSSKFPPANRLMLGEISFSGYGGDTYRYVQDNNIHVLIQKLAADAANSIGYDYFQQTACGSLNGEYREDLPNDGHRYYHYDFTLWLRYFDGEDPILKQDLYQIYAEKQQYIVRAEVYSSESSTTPILVTKDIGEINELISHTVAVPNARQHHFTVPDADYCLAIYVEVPQDGQTVQNIFVTDFLANDIPAAVLAAN